MTLLKGVILHGVVDRVVRDEIQYTFDFIENNVISQR